MGTAATIAAAVLCVSGLAPANVDAKEAAAKKITHPAHEPCRLSAVVRASDLVNYNVNGAASWYGAEFDGRLDARGERFDSSAMTAAHRTLPLNSVVEVTNLRNGRHVQVRITDRGPFAHRRVIDLSRAAADALGYTQDGVARVNVRAVSAD